MKHISDSNLFRWTLSKRLWADITSRRRRRRCWTTKTTTETPPTDARWGRAAPTLGPPRTTRRTTNRNRKLQNDAASAPFGDRQSLKKVQKWPSRIFHRILTTSRKSDALTTGINTTKLFLPYLNDGVINYCQGPIPKIFGICMQGQILTILGENSVTGSFQL